MSYALLNTQYAQNIKFVFTFDYPPRIRSQSSTPKLFQCHREQLLMCIKTLLKTQREQLQLVCITNTPQHIARAFFKCSLKAALNATLLSTVNPLNRRNLHLEKMLDSHPWRLILF